MEHGWDSISELLKAARSEHSMVEHWELQLVEHWAVYWEHETESSSVEQWDACLEPHLAVL